MKQLLLVTFSWGLVLAFVVALLVRLICQDRLPILATIYYATPVAVLALAAGLSGFFWWLAGKPKRAILSCVAAVLCCVWCTYDSYYINADNRAETDATVVFWNVARGRRGWDGIIKTLSEYEPDIVGLVEVRGNEVESRRYWKSVFPKHEVTDVESGMLLICKGRITQIQNGPLRRGGRYRHARLETNGGILHLVIVDIHSNPLMFRREPIEEIVDLTSKIGDEPIIVMGDFNTPGDSRHVDTLRRDFVNAFETHGRGYSATWPLPFPVLQLDHIWANKQVALSACQAGWTWSSDHRPIVAWLRTR